MNKTILNSFKIYLLAFNVSFMFLFTMEENVSSRKS